MVSADSKMVLADSKMVSANWKMFSADSEMVLANSKMVSTNWKMVSASAEQFCHVIVTDLRDAAVTGFTMTQPFDRNKNGIDTRQEAWDRIELEQ